MGVWAKDVGKESVRLVAKGLTRRRGNVGSQSSLRKSLTSPFPPSSPILNSGSSSPVLDSGSSSPAGNSGLVPDLFLEDDSFEGELRPDDTHGSGFDDHSDVSSGARGLKESSDDDEGELESFAMGLGSGYLFSKPADAKYDAPEHAASQSKAEKGSGDGDRVGVLDLPNEILFEILGHLPTSSLIPLLKTPRRLSNVTSSELSTRLYSIRTLEDLKSFVRCGGSVWGTSAALGPLFYRAGTIVLFARYFMRLIPEAKALLGVGYAVVLAWFMCVFYAVPFLGALVLYSAMDIVDAVSQILTYSISAFPLSIRAIILPKAHYLHPKAIATAVPSVPPHLVQRLRFEGPTPIVSPSDPPRCCGPAGSLTPFCASAAAGNGVGQGSIEEVGGFAGGNGIENLGEPISGFVTAVEGSGESILTTGQQPGGSAKSQNWGLMSPYTPWHLYLLTYAVSNHTVVSSSPTEWGASRESTPLPSPSASPIRPDEPPKPSGLRRRRSKILPPPSYSDLMAKFNALSASASASASTPMASAATAVTIRLATPWVSLLSFVVSVIARYLVWVYVKMLRALVHTGGAMGWTTRPLRRLWRSSSPAALDSEPVDSDDDGLEDLLADADVEDEPSVKSPSLPSDPHRHLLTARVVHGVTRLTLSRVSLAWWFRLHPVPSLRALTMERCEVDENGISIVAAACQGVVGLVLRRCEVRGGDGGWRAREAAPLAPHVQQQQQQPHGEHETVGGVDHDVEGEPETAGPMASTASSFNLHDMKRLAGIGVFPRLRLVRFELCGPASCGVDAVRMVLDRSPVVERVEFVGCGPVEEALLEAGGVVEIERIDDGRGVDDIESCVEDRIRRRGVALEGGGRGMGDGPLEGGPAAAAAAGGGGGGGGGFGGFPHGSGTTLSTAASCPPVPPGFRKCYVVQGPSVRGLRSVWNAHLKARQRELWEGHI
ncbi:hypothetical protein HDU67_000234 [Dinochytrium kinnereticum]|nr:hypothetical protein HDU67_000234 [Dinochytrium kinnereticum]